MKISGCSIEIENGSIKGFHKIAKGCFVFVGTLGLPLEIVVDYLKSKNITIDWMDFCTDALKDGWNPKTIKARILEANGDVFGAEYRKNIEQRLAYLFS